MRARVAGIVARSVRGRFISYEGAASRLLSGWTSNVIHSHIPLPIQQLEVTGAEGPVEEEDMDDEDSLPPLEGDLPDLIPLNGHSPSNATYPGHSQG